MGSEIAVKIERIDGRLIVMPDSPSAQSLLSLTGAKFINPKHLSVMQRTFGVDIRITSGMSYLRDSRIAPVYKSIILKYLPWAKDRSATKQTTTAERMPGPTIIAGQLDAISAYVTGNSSRTGGYGSVEAFLSSTHSPNVPSWLDGNEVEEVTEEEEE